MVGTDLLRLVDVPHTTCVEERRVRIAAIARHSRRWLTRSMDLISEMSHGTAPLEDGVIN